MADEKNRKGDKGPKSGKTKRTVGTAVSYTPLTLPTIRLV